jgi:hypothetical protein
MYDRIIIADYRRPGHRCVFKLSSTELFANFSLAFSVRMRLICRRKHALLTVSTIRGGPRDTLLSAHVLQV